MRKLATLMLGTSLAVGTALAQVDQTTDEMNQTETQTQEQEQRDQDQFGDEDFDFDMPDTAANWLAMVLGGGALGAAGLGLRRK